MLVLGVDEGGVCGGGGQRGPQAPHACSSLSSEALFKAPVNAASVAADRLFLAVASLEQPAAAPEDLVQDVPGRMSRD